MPVRPSGAAANLLVPIPASALVAPITLGMLAVLIRGSYRLIERTFKSLKLALLAYIGAACFARPDPGDVLRGTFIPTFSLDGTFLSTLVAILGTTISPYFSSGRRAPKSRARSG
jgi:Mn2+/Fe2+ NRAMP family transporter